MAFASAYFEAAMQSAEDRCAAAPSEHEHARRGAFDESEARRNGNKRQVSEASEELSQEEDVHGIAVDFVDHDFEDEASVTKFSCRTRLQRTRFSRTATAAVVAP
eukprot:TRINITY_DN32590_c0_g1_i2.p2 TRINITY_DN32590_c0_g1~~TRINITY_DN32590_c0_g1_i2.p2  ORF type:complete len:105 (+),score=22.03 TRINITY_DN32590_c0_g1_i2:74-388(+)